MAALQALREVTFLTAGGLIAELGDLDGFCHPRKLMAYLGLAPSEHSSGPSVRRGAITKAGNPHVWRVAWAYQTKGGSVRSAGAFVFLLLLILLSARSEAQVAPHAETDLTRSIARLSSLSNDSSARAATFNFQSLADDWQTRYDDAVRKKRGGLVLAAIGLPIAVAGATAPLWMPRLRPNDCVTRPTELDCNRRALDAQSRTVYLGAALGVPGAVLGWIGLHRMGSAGREILALDLARTRAADPAGGAVREGAATPGTWVVEFRSFFGLERWGTLRVNEDLLVFTPTSDQADDGWEMPLSAVRDVRSRRGGWVEIERVRVGRQYLGGVRFRPIEVPAVELTSAIQSAAAQYREAEPAR